MSSEQDRMAGALWGLMIGDALGVPAHWYYGVEGLKKAYGEIKGYEDAKHPHEESFMKSSPYAGSIDILHDKKKFFDIKNAKFEAKDDTPIDDKLDESQGRYHYHNGMKAGDNTCDIYLIRALMKQIVEKKAYTEDDFLQLFYDFFTTPGSHPDTFLSAYIRAYFKNLSKEGTKPADAAERQIDNWGMTSAVGMLGGFVPALLNHRRPATATSRAIHHINLTARSENLSTAALILCPLVLNLIHGKDNEQALKDACESVRLPKLSGTEQRGLYSKYGGPDNITFELMSVVHQHQKNEPFDPSAYFDREDVDFALGVSATACYAEYATPTILYLASKYPKEFEKTLLASTNFGGDTTARNSLLGVVMGAAVGKSGIPKHLIEGLKNHEAIDKEIQAFVDLAFAE